MAEGVAADRDTTSILDGYEPCHLDSEADQPFIAFGAWYAHQTGDRE
ncbi:hypothetical protein [Prescottella agglutinans]|nr:hypothetical protein [Prescottella agglutinans]